MSINGVLGTAVSGLQTAQTGLRAVSDNIANVNTPGYVRKQVLQTPLVVNGIAYVIREWFDGHNLDTVLSQGPLEPRPLEDHRVEG